MTDVATEKVSLRLAGDGIECGALPVFDPASGALVSDAAKRVEIERALRRFAYRLAFRMYCRLPGVYFRLFAIKVGEARLHAARYFFRNLLNFRENIHRTFPRWFTDYPSYSALSRL